MIYPTLTKTNFPLLESITKNLKQEGFWYSDHEPHYPKAIHSDEVHPKKADILKAYDELLDEDRFNPERNRDTWKDNKNVLSFRGCSYCRCCPLRNGSRQYVLNGWEWPEGYRHYIDKHNVIPSKNWLKEVLGIEL